MRRGFADTHFYLALLNRRDADHARASEIFARGEFAEFVTTTGIILEVADGMCGLPERERCIRFLDRLRGQPNTKVVELNDALIWRGYALYCTRLDKEWSLTDCISFVVMADAGLTEALTGDHHFEQAGFTAVLAS